MIVIMNMDVMFLTRCCNSPRSGDLWCFEDQFSLHVGSYSKDIHHKPSRCVQSHQILPMCEILEYKLERATGWEQVKFRNQPEFTEGFLSAAVELNAPGFTWSTTFYNKRKRLIAHFFFLFTRQKKKKKNIWINLSVLCRLDTWISKGNCSLTTQSHYSEFILIRMIFFFCRVIGVQRNCLLFPF